MYFQKKVHFLFKFDFLLFFSKWSLKIVYVWYNYYGDNMNKTKIIATIGPSSNSKENLRKLMQKGMDVVRINLSHASYSQCIDIVEKINELNVELKTNVAIMFDTKGPDVRVGRFCGGEACLNEGAKIRIYMDEIVGDSTKFSVSYPNLINDVKYDTIIKLDSGLIELKVLDKGRDYLLCEVLSGGIIRDNRSLNVPNIHLNRAFLNKKDIEDIKFAHKMGGDFLALSFVETAENILEVNDLLIELEDDHMSIIAKIENETAVDEIDGILSVCDGVMIARGDLGVEIPMERIPGIQKMIVNKCLMAGKISIVATELMSSMECQIRPTRAEVSDVANAVLDGADAVMLSGETTIGKYPIEALSTMEKIIASAELDIDYMDLLDRAVRTEKQDITGILAYNVAESANRLKCKAIITPTVSGYTARKISRFRPSCPIIAASPNISTVKSLALCFGVTPIVIDELKTFDKIIDKARDITKELIETEANDRIIITGGYPFKGVKHTNFMKIEEL